MDLDIHLSDVEVDWAPAYELLLSLNTFLFMARGASLIELGPAWAAEVRERLPSDLRQALSRKSIIRDFKEHEVDRLMLLVAAAPGERDAPGFVDWFAHLTPGAAYEALAPRTPEPGPRLPRDFVDWRDSLAQVLGAWNDSYFAGINPAILCGLREAAECVRARLPTCEPAELVEEVTHGLVPEPSPQLQRVVLVPQYHNRPYNDTVEIACGSIILYPCDVLPTDPQLPPPTLMRLTHALSDTSRLRILRFLRKGPSTLTEVARHAGLSQPTVHHHLVQLRTAGLVRVHCISACGPSRYSLRPHALEQLSSQLGAYLLIDAEDDTP